VRVVLLGQLRVLDDTGAEVTPTGARQRSLLACLLMRANTPVSAETLVDTVWDGCESGNTETMLRSVVMRLRRALGPELAARIVAHPPGYLIQVDGPELDVVQFEALCHEAGAALRDRAWETAAQAAARAAGLWQGEALLDIPSQTLRAQVVPRLELLRLQALDDGVEADLNLGRHAELAPRLRELTARHPLRERFHAQLMVALSRAGRRAEALAVYRDARRVLIEELGIEPGPDLQHVHQRVLTGDCEPPAPKHAEGDRQAGASPAPRQLPAATRHFTGRHTELDVVTGLLEGADRNGGTVVISAIDGMAGIGKTALAIHAGHRLAEQFPDGQLFIDLYGYTQDKSPRDPGDALAVLLRGLRVPSEQIPAEPDARAALYRDRLAGTRTLVVLDNAADENQVIPLLPGTAGCLVLVTSRRRLKSLDDAILLQLDVLSGAEAVQLLRRAAGLPPDAADHARCQEVAELCGRLPLALLIAAALLRTGGPAWNLHRLIDRLATRHPGRELAGYTDDTRSLTAVFDLSYQTLPSNQRLLFRRVGLVPGPEIDAYAAAALLDCGVTEADLRLQHLSDHSLLIGVSPGRYRIHDLLRAHIRSLHDEPDPDLGPDDQRAAALSRLLDYYQYTARRADALVASLPQPPPDAATVRHVPSLADRQSGWAWLRAERANLDAAFDHARSHDLAPLVMTLAAGLAQIMLTDGPWTRARGVHEAAAAAASLRADRRGEAGALVNLGRLRLVTSDLAGAVEAYSRALDSYRDLGDRQGEAASLNGLGRVRQMTGDYPGAADAYAQTLTVYRKLGDRPGHAGALAGLGRVRQMTGDYPGAADAYGQALAVYGELGDRPGQAGTLIGLGSVRRLTGDLATAVGALTHALDICRTLGYRLGQAVALVELGRVRQANRDHRAANDTYTQALAIYRDLGSRNGEAWALNHYAALLATTGEPAQAQATYHRALAMNRELNKPDDEALSHEGIGECLVVAGDLRAGAEHLHQALQIFQRLGMRPDLRRVQTRLTDLAEASGRDLSLS
jgi:DNA-binding SARP family transcriptional activator/tetratricopeptide (TPR) repeat protein